MSVLVGNPFFLGAGASAGAAYKVERSLRFNSSDTAYLSRTPASAGNRKTWTWAGWVKGVVTSENPHLFTCTTGATDATYFRLWFVSDSIRVSNYNNNLRQTSAVYRDPSAWYHIVLAVDTTQATAANRIKLYVNGSEVTAFSSSVNPSQNDDLGINQAAAHSIGATSAGGGTLSAYLADVHFIDGQALTPSDFTEVSATTGQLIPKEYTGTFGTNGFWLKFSDNSAATATTLGKDYSGNNNNWTPNNLSVTAGAGNDSLTDTPTSYGTDTGAGGEVRGNYATWNPLDNNTKSTGGNGNLEAVITGADALYGNIRATHGIGQKTYWETVVAGTSRTYQYHGIAPSDSALVASGSGGIGYGNVANSVGVYCQDGTVYVNGSSVLTQSLSIATNDVLMHAYDPTSGKYWAGRNGSWFNSGNPAAGTGQVTTLSTSKQWMPAVSSASTQNITANFGQRPFAYTAPSGFKALCDTNLPAPVVAKPSTVMDVKLYTGNDSTQSISLGFSPDFLWFKSRSTASQHALYDIIRGASKSLVSNSTASEATEGGGLATFDSAGFSLSGDNTIQGSTNGSGRSYVVWAWDAGSSTVTNTQGSITSQVRANASAGFSIVAYTGTGVNATVGHGLGVAPGFFIVKQRTNAGWSWNIYHISLGPTKVVRFTTDLPATVATIWNNAAPTSAVFSLGNANEINQSTSEYITYCFAPVAGYSSFGSYTGNSSTDGPFVFCNFRPRWILIKQVTSSGDGWYIYDAQRIGYNPTNLYLWANGSNEEQTSGNFDLLSNGFKLRTTASALNYTGYTYIYAAFAESPFQYARAR